VLDAPTAPTQQQQQQQQSQVEQPSAAEQPPTVDELLQRLQQHNAQDQGTEEQQDTQQQQQQQEAVMLETLAGQLPRAELEALLERFVLNVHAVHYQRVMWISCFRFHGGLRMPHAADMHAVFCGSDPCHVHIIVTCICLYCKHPFLRVC
jgi:hypothetical protein